MAVAEALRPLTAEEVIAIYNAEAFNQGAVDFNKIAQWATEAGYDYKDPKYIEIVTNNGVTPVYNKEGVVTGYNLRGTANLTNTQTINSNVSTVSRGTLNAPATTAVNQSGKMTSSRLAGVGSRLATGAAMVGTAAVCVSAGITLGKTIDSVLYNLNPDFWDSNGMSSLNPETWRQITAGDTSWNADVINMLFGFDDNGNTQAYMDETALAYMAMYMNQQGVFATGEQYYEYTDGGLISGRVYNQGNILYPQPATMYLRYNRDTSVYNSYTPSDSNVICVATKIGSSTLFYWLSDSPFTIDLDNSGSHSTITPQQSTITVDGVTKTYYQTNRTHEIGTSGRTWTIYTPYILNDSAPYYSWSASDIAQILFFGDYISSTPIEGIGDQTGATLPDTTGWNDIDDVLSSLQTQYPGLWNDAITYPVVQPDGTTKNFTYVPVAMPEAMNRTDTQPTSGESTQANPLVNVNTSPESLVQYLTQLLQQPYPETDPNSTDPPTNPPDTGEGSSPTPTVPVGSASSLWKIYHPTQAQIDSFGGWLWSSNFIDQILKIFNNPMEAVIGLHKVYATPVDAGNTTIKVGYLDSQVPSAYIEQQYIYVSCGSINLDEYFGNVLDYSPYTDIQLYLPFIGIVPLDTSDIMRSTISITYGVDVITGACLAMVEISRDGYDAVLYQYSGNCAVQYPISSGSYMGIVSSIISVAGGVAATVASGGAAAPLALGAAGGLLNAHTSVQHSGGFSGNSGAMGCKIPYVIISRPQSKIADNSEAFIGYPTNDYVTIGECDGYIQAESAHVVNVNATDEELNEINNLLLSGIII